MRIAVMGFGNPCRSDDAVGVYIIDTLKKKYGVLPDVSFFDMGTGAFELLFQLKGHTRIIIADAVINTGEQPGTIYKLPAEEVAAAPEDDPMVFLHSIKWNQALSYAKKILREEYPDDITVYLVAVDNIKLEMELSEDVMKAGDKVAALIKEELDTAFADERQA